MKTFTTLVMLVMMTAASLAAVQTKPPPGVPGKVDIPGKHTKDEFNNSMSFDPRTFTVTFHGVSHQGNHVSGIVSVHWEEQILGTRVVLIDGNYEFDFTDRQRLLDYIITVYDVPIHIYVDILYTDPNKLCLDYRAEWLGGNVGNYYCTTIRSTTNTSK